MSVLIRTWSWFLNRAINGVFFSELESLSNWTSVFCPLWPFFVSSFHGRSARRNRLSSVFLVRVFAEIGSGSFFPFSIKDSFLELLNQTFFETSESTIFLSAHMLCNSSFLMDSAADVIGTLRAILNIWTRFNVKRISNRFPRQMFRFMTLKGALRKWRNGRSLFGFSNHKQNAWWTILTRRREFLCSC